jgi:hypothetical protein
MKKLIRDATIHYEIRNLTTNKRTGKTAPSSKLYRKGKIEKLTVAKDLDDVYNETRVLNDIALKNKKKIEDIVIKITKLDFGNWSAWSNDIY